MVGALDVLAVGSAGLAAAAPGAAVAGAGGLERGFGARRGWTLATMW